MIDSLLLDAYSQPSAVRGYLDGIFNASRTRYYSLGRWALLEALRLAGVKAGDRVLLPSFICRALIAPIRKLGAESIFYPVNESLQPAVSPEDLPAAKAVIAVNFFGFPQNMTPFKQYCLQKSAALIEDNAHGLFSRDEEGNFLGGRGDVGIFSLRKTLPLINGGMLLVNHPGMASRLRQQSAFMDSFGRKAFQRRQAVRKLMVFMGPYGVWRMILMARKMRGLMRGHEIPLSGPEDEMELPGPENPCRQLSDAEPGFDSRLEIARRRRLYEQVAQIAKKHGLRPVFQNMGSETCPYVFPFYVSKGQEDAVKRLFYSYGLDCAPWPDLPGSVENQCPAHYKSVRVVHLFW